MPSSQTESLHLGPVNPYVKAMIFAYPLFCSSFSLCSTVRVAPFLSNDIGANQSRTCPLVLWRGYDGR
jgi:hypothetical protein